MHLLPATIPLLVAATSTGLTDADVDRSDVILAAIVYTGSRGDDIEDEDYEVSDAPDPLIVCDEDEDDVDPCRVEALIREAAYRGAAMAVVSEAAFEEAGYEAVPVVGRLPPPSSPVQHRFSVLAEELEMYIVIALNTGDERGHYSSQVAFAPDGRVVARHHKFELYDDESSEYVAGDDVSVFPTPFGRVGLLICSDLYGDPRMHHRLVDELGANIIALSSIWTVPDSIRWQSAFAHDWGVTLVAANGAAADGKGAGIYDSDGDALVTSRAGHDLVLTSPID